MAKNAMYLSLLVIIGFALTSQSFADKVDSTTLNDLKKEGKDTIEKTEEIPSNKQNDESILKIEEDDTAENDVKESDDKVQESSTEEAEDEGKGSENYGQGSVCVYCQYCKFCKLCDKDCPCKKSKRRPNCHMCKYCKYCYLCSSVCDNFCQPGSFLDTVSSAVWSALPKFDNKMKGEVEKDIESVKNWIKDYL